MAQPSSLRKTGGDSPLVPNPVRDPSLGPPVVRLDNRYYGSSEDLDARFPDAPSLVRARSLEVTGDVRFGRGVSVVGRAVVSQGGSSPLRIDDGTVLGG